MEAFHTFRKVHSPGFCTVSKEPMALLDQATPLVLGPPTTASIKHTMKSHLHYKYTREAFQAWFPKLFPVIKCPLINFLAPASLFSPQ